MSRKAIILGAGGRLGKTVVKAALDAKYDVSAFVRNRESFEKAVGDLSSRVNVIIGDALDVKSVADAVRGQDVVFSVVAGMENLHDMYKVIVAACKQAGVTRLVATGGAGALSTADGKYLFEKLTSFGEWFTNVSKLHVANYELLRDSGLTWTLICPPSMIDTEGSSEVKISVDVPTGLSKVAYSTVGTFMVAEVDNQQYQNHRVGLGDAVLVRQSAAEHAAKTAAAAETKSAV